MKTLMEEIERCLPDGGQWCTLEKAQTLAAIIVGLRPQTIVEIGVWQGGSLVPMLLALKHNRSGTAFAIDPWSAEASKAGEVPQNAEWWGSINHDKAHSIFIDRLEKHGLAPYCEVWRERSDDVAPPEAIDLLHVDGNHTEQAVRDVERFCPKVRIGGIAVLDDVAWEQGYVGRGVEIARAMGFAELYVLGTGLVMQRRGTNEP